MGNEAGNAVPGLHHSIFGSTGSELAEPFTKDALIVDTLKGYAIADMSKQAEIGDTIAFQFLGHPTIGKFYGHSLVTEDGEAIEGEALEEVVVLGKIVCEILTLEQNEGPV